MRIVWEGEEEEGEHRGATRMKDVSLPVCHKSSVLLCDRLADRAGSVSAGTHRLLLYSHISFFYIYIYFFLRCSSHFLRQSEGGRKRAATGSMSRKQTRVSLVRLLVSVKVYGLCRAESPQSTIMTRRDNRESAATGWIHSAAFEWCLKINFFFSIMPSSGYRAAGENERLSRLSNQFKASQVYYYRPGLRSVSPQRALQTTQNTVYTVIRTM